ncbi:MAG: phosphopeptide-binding protein [Chitinophagales bacterium]|nr:phosphopeptide-binding protein [Bacteroidota bacterium]MCB9256712.1 phosphopeptide-binding protein [Chitinophagales bacterium]
MKKYLAFISLATLFLFACKENSNNTEILEESPEELVEIVMEKDGIKLSSNQNATEFKNASLSLIAPESGVQDTGTQTFRFEVMNYDLAVPTSDVLSGQCANSGQGQHIHYIWDNEPYTAHYEAEFEKNINEGHHVLLAFLSRSYHMSLKNPEAYVLTEFNTNAAEDNFDEHAAHLFYSRPKGTYEGADANKVMLDFYLVNTNLEDQGYTVRATINGVSFDLEKWMPYFIEGLAEGENTIALELLDAEGNLVSSPFNPVERKIIVKYNSETI